MNGSGQLLDMKLLAGVYPVSDVVFFLPCCVCFVKLLTNNCLFVLFFEITYGLVSLH